MSNQLLNYLNKRSISLQKSIDDWGDVLSNPPPEYDGLEGYYKDLGSLEEIENLKNEVMLLL